MEASRWSGRLFSDGADAVWQVWRGVVYLERAGVGRCGDPGGRAIVAHAKVAEEPPCLLTVPDNAGKLALSKAEWSAEDLDLVEINEAFAGVTLHSSEMLSVSEEIVNVNGGAVALGHSIGASGVRIL